MSHLRQTLDDYLAVRRALGFKLRCTGGVLCRFVEFAEAQGAAFITTELALIWAQQPTAADPSQWANRLGMVRRFAQHCSALDPRTEVPPQALLPHRLQRKPPYLYSDDEILHLFEAAKRLPTMIGRYCKPPGLRAATFSTLLALIAVTGMRMSEPIGLDRDDVDLTHGVLTIRGTKFGKSRHLPIERSTQLALAQYQRQRDRLCRHPQCPAFFLSERGTRITEWALRWTFVKLSREIGLRGPADHRGPRLHDLRHYPERRIIPTRPPLQRTSARNLDWPPVIDAG